MSSGSCFAFSREACVLCVGLVLLGFFCVCVFRFCRCGCLFVYVLLPRVRIPCVMLWCVLLCTLCVHDLTRLHLFLTLKL